jgi:hypothetical protein
MFVEIRFYATLPGKRAEFLRLYRDEGLAIQQPVQGPCLGIFSHEFGPQEQVITMWRYAGLDDRAARRARLAQLPEWQAFLGKVGPLVSGHETRLLRAEAGEVVTLPAP